MHAILSSHRFRHAALGALCVTLFGCATPGTPTVGSNVQYGDAKAVEQVTNEFGSSDLQAIAETMARSLAQYTSTLKGRPIVSFSGVKNKTSEYVDTTNITDSIRNQLMKSGTVRFATDIAGMQNAIDEQVRLNNSGLYKKSASGTGPKSERPKYRLEGNLTSIVKRGADVKDVYYKFSLIMTDNESNLLEWSEEKEIRKTSRR